MGADIVKYLESDHSRTLLLAARKFGITVQETMKLYKAEKENAKNK